MNFNITEEQIKRGIKEGRLIPFDDIHKEDMKDPEYRKMFKQVSKEMHEENERLLRKELADKVRKARSLSGFTQQQLADRMHTTKSYISLVENGKQNVTVEFVVKVATALGRRVEIEIY